MQINGTNDVTPSSINDEIECNEEHLGILTKSDRNSEAGSSHTRLTRDSTTRRLDRYLTAIDAAKPMSIEFINMNAKVLIKSNSSENKYKQILYNISGTINSGEFVALMGPSGAGKSTLLNVLGLRFEGVYSGKVLINNKIRTKSTKRKIGYVLQNDILLENLTVFETLQFTAKMRLPKKMSMNNKLQRVNDIIYLMGLNKCKDTMVQSCSGGEQKRVSIANEMIVNPSVLFLGMCKCSFCVNAIHNI